MGCESKILELFMASCYTNFVLGALAHLVERFHGMEEVRSSNLLCSTISNFTALIVIW